MEQPQGETQDISKQNSEKEQQNIEEQNLEETQQQQLKQEDSDIVKNEEKEEDSMLEENNLKMEDEEDDFDEEDDENENDNEDTVKTSQNNQQEGQQQQMQNNNVENNNSGIQVKQEHNNNNQQQQDQQQQQQQQDPNQQQQQQQQQNGEKPRKRYSVITQEVREKFIERVLSRQVTIKAAAKEFGIKFSTSKAILQTFKREGRTCKKKTRQRTNPRMVPSTITQEPLYGLQEQQNNYYDDNENENQNKQDQKDGNNNKSGQVKKNQQQQQQQQQPHAVAGLQGLASRGGSFMNKLRFAGRGLSINTNWNLQGGNFNKINIPQKQQDTNQFPNPFERNPREGLLQQGSILNHRRLGGSVQWDVKQVEQQLKNIDVDLLKNQARNKEITPQSENDFNYTKYFSTSDVF